MLALQGITKCFGTTVAVDAADLEVARGEFFALLGPSGCGKTTLLRLVAGFERPDAGAIEIDGRRVAGAGTWVPPERRRVGVVFQDYALFPHLDVAGNVGFGLPRARRARRVAEVLELVGLEGHARRRPGELSGGQQQRIALARALAPEPRLVVLDEPWSAVDAVRREELRLELARILRTAGVTVVLVTHDREEAFTLADRVALQRDGRILQTGAPEQLYLDPTDAWCARFLGTSNLIPTAEGARLVRPELVGLEEDPAAAAEVVERTFLGHDVLYRVRLDDGTVLSSQRPSTERVGLGSRVRVTYLDGPTPTFPR